MINLEELDGRSIKSFDVEIVERKGLGHPDTICDHLAEEISKKLSKTYLSIAGKVLHYNIDKILLSAGKTKKTFAGGSFLEPIKIFVGDRATYKYGDIEIPVNNMVKSSIKNWFKRHIRHIELKHIKTTVLLKEGSEELTSIFKDKKNLLSANDTSTGVGYYPLTPLENITLEIERYLNSAIFKEKHPYTGEDVKVMSLREKKTLNITIAMPFLSKSIRSEKEYFLLKDIVLKELEVFITSRWREGKVNIDLNTLDKKGAGIEGIYLTLTGTSAEDADSGEVGRGNRANGLISFMRPHTSEAVAGKNPVSHIGKIYNFFAFYLAERVYKNFENIEEIYIYILSRIGTPIDNPLCLYCKILPSKKISKPYYDKISAFLEKEIKKINTFCDKIISGKISLV